MPRTKLEIHQKSLEMCYRESKSQEADESEFNRKVGYEGGSQTLRAREKRGATLCLIPSGPRASAVTAMCLFLKWKVGGSLFYNILNVQDPGLFVKTVETYGLFVALITNNRL